MWNFLRTPKKSPRRRRSGAKACSTHQHLRDRRFAQGQTNEAVPVVPIRLAGDDLRAVLAAGRVNARRRYLLPQLEIRT
jgi:hypothetical protein